MRRLISGLTERAAPTGPIANAVANLGIDHSV
jgi:hypothetical protein